MGKPLYALVLCAAFGLIGPALVAACIPGEQRFPICKSNAECVERKDGQQAPVCWNLKCVQCRYDTDCKPGEACSSGNTCDRIESTAPVKDDGKDDEAMQPPKPEPAPEDKPEDKPAPKPVRKPAPRPVKKESGASQTTGGNWNDCVAGCKDDKACVQACTDKHEK